MFVKKDANDHRRARSCKIYIRAHTRNTTHKTRLDKTPRRGMRTHTHIRQTQQDTHNKTSTTRHAQQDTSTHGVYRRSLGLPSRGLHSWDFPPASWFPPPPRGRGVNPGRGRGRGNPGRGGGGRGGEADTPAPSQLESQWESQEDPNQLQDPLLRASHGANTGSVIMLRRGSGQDRRGAGRQTSCCRNSVCRPVCW